MPQQLMKNEPKSLEISTKTKWEEYVETVEVILDDYWLASNRNEMDDKRWERTVQVWARHLYSNKVPESKLKDVYDRALKIDRFLTVPVMLEAWAEISEELIQTQSILGQLTGKNCSICKGSGKAINFNFDTRQDEEVTCICSQGE